MKAALPVLALAAAAAATAPNGLSLTFYADRHCDGDVVAHRTVGPAGALLAEGTCGADLAPDGVEIGSVRVRGIEDYNRDGAGGSRIYGYGRSGRSSLRFYASGDCSTSCRERNVIETTSWDGCEDLSHGAATGGTLRSFDVVERGDTGFGYGALADAGCELAHGDEVRIDGRQWKVQQVALGLFQQVPLEEWDDTVHERNATARFARHGELDARGRHKFWQDAPDSIESVHLENWDEERHQKVTDVWELELDRYRRRVKGLCEQVPEDKVGADGFITITDDIRVACGDHAEKERQRHNDFWDDDWRPSGIYTNDEEVRFPGY